MGKEHPYLAGRTLLHLNPLVVAHASNLNDSTRSRWSEKNLSTIIVPRAFSALLYKWQLVQDLRILCIDAKSTTREQNTIARFLGQTSMISNPIQEEIFAPPSVEITQHGQHVDSNSE